MTTQAPIILVYHTKSQKITPLHNQNILFNPYENSVVNLLKENLHKSSCFIEVNDKKYSATFHPYAGDIIVLIYEMEKGQEYNPRKFTNLDPLTGLLNQHYFIDKVNKIMQKMTASEKGLLIYLQLDQFSSIQDVLGYRSSEKVLDITAQRLKRLFGEVGVISRFGFGHFVLFLPADSNGNLTSIDMAKVNEELNSPMVVQEQDVYMTHSYGMSVYPDDGNDAKMCIQMAQVALNTGKKTHAREVKARFNKKMFHLMEDDLIVEMNLRKGLDLNQFELYYQPQIDCESGKIVGFEGLIRWNHPERGLIPPREFINLAESTGLILPIGEWVIRQAFTKLEKWKSNQDEDRTLSINISPRHFLHRTIFTFFKDCLNEFDVNPEQLIVEITESVAMEDFETVKMRITELRTLGISVSIDDFGTGFSAFRYLQHFSIQEIKIDRQFIRDITKNEKSMSIAKTIIDLAKMLNINVVSEGVETEEQWKILKALGCPQLQGFYFSKPLPNSDLRKWISTYHQEVPINK